MYFLNLSTLCDNLITLMGFRVRLESEPQKKPHQPTPTGELPVDQQQKKITEHHTFPSLISQLVRV